MPRSKPRPSSQVLVLVPTRNAVHLGMGDFFKVHPMGSNAAIEEVKSREKSLEKAYYPKFLLQGTSYARGIGAFNPLQGPSNAGNPVSRLGPNIQNWALGFTMLFPILDYPAIRVRKEAEVQKEKAEQAKYDQVLRELQGQLDRSRAMLMAAQRIATNVPIQLKAAREAIKAEMEAKRLKRFTEADVDGNGTLSKEEFAKTLPTTAPAEAVDRLFTHLDTDKDGSISKTEFQAHMAVPPRPAPPAAVAAP